MSEALAECLFNIPPILCGLPMEPLSIWHVWMLEFVRSPYIGAAPGGTASDLALALTICSRKAVDPLEASFDLRPSPKLIEQIDKEGILETSLAFQTYLSDYNALPKVWEGGDGRPVKSPLCLYLVAVLIRHGRFPHAAAWKLPYGYGRHLVLALAEAGGNEIPLISDSEVAALKEAGHVL